MKNYSISRLALLGLTFIGDYIWAGCIDSMVVSITKQDNALFVSHEWIPREMQLYPQNNQTFFAKENANGVQFINSGNDVNALMLLNDDGSPWTSSTNQAMVFHKLKKNEQSLGNRLATYSTISNKLNNVNDTELENLLKTAKKLGSGYGDTALLNVDGTKVFVKQIPLTELEQKKENIHSTANIFNLPTFYQYGVGSAGFGAWRELAAQTMASNWVLTGECENFPLMYHWRVLPRPTTNQANNDTFQKIEESVQYWDNSSAIRERLNALNSSTKSVVLFLENIPQTLESWLEEKCQHATKDNYETLTKAIPNIEKQLESTTAFMASHGMIHFDAHSHNIVTDGHQIYFVDFGLALCANFDLSSEEKIFYEQHKLYDRIYTRGSFVSRLGFLAYPVVKNLQPTSSEDVLTFVQECINGNELHPIVPAITPILKKYAACAMVGDAFLRQLEISKSTPYPAHEVELLVNSVIS